MVKKSKLVTGLLFLILFTVSVYAQKKNGSASFWFIQLTDPQFGYFEANKAFTKETELYEKAVSIVNRLNPDFVVITGDLVHNKEERSQVNEFKRITAKINPKIPVYYSPGNHDIGVPTTQKDIDSFVSDYGYDRFSFRHKKNLFIGINTCIIKSNMPELEQIQFDWLEKELSRGKKANNRIIFTHYPFFINSYDEPETYSNIGVDTRNKYLALFKEYNVDAVFAGHTHYNASAKYGNMDMISTNAVGKPGSKVQSGLRIIKVYPDRVESVFYEFDEVPEKIILQEK